MAVSIRTIGRALADLVGPGAVSDEGGTLAAAGIDGLTPRWVVTPASLEHAATVVALAHEEHLAVAPRGGGHALELGGVPARLDVVLDLRRLDRVLEDSPADLVVTVQAGITAGALADRLAARRQWLPLDPPAWRRRTLGGLCATNASGPLRQRYGTLRDLLLGVRFVQADGVLTWGGAKVVKSVTGYDVPKLMTGSLGTLGVLGELTLRLHPAPEAAGAWLATFTDVRAAREFVARLTDSTVQPNRVELLDAVALQACGAAGHAGIAVGIGSVAEAVRAQGEQVTALATRAGGRVTPVTEAFWTAYEAAALGGDTTLRVSVPPTAVPEAVAAVRRATAPFARPPLIHGCAALGALAVVIGGVPGHAVAAGVETLRDAIAGPGGSVVVARAPRAVRERVDAWGPVAPEVQTIMRRLKETFDPERVLNPGRFVGGL
ncbi:MAG: FAD-binding oxidoreductase [Candidatus Rokubacteria bacterium]|nr:FAD-binding oxidoreductase [Candidatus Rokubacteria bacterium]